MKKRLIIDNRTEEKLGDIIKILENILPEINASKNRYQVNLIKGEIKDIYCMFYKNKCSIRLLFAYEELKQEELF